MQRKFKDLKDQTFGEWKVLKYLGKSMWLCECSCGEQKPVHRYSLLSGTSKSCGHKSVEDITDKRFGRLVAKKYIGNQKWYCECDCGGSVVAYAQNLKAGHTKSCGCIRLESIPTREDIVTKIEEYIKHTGEKPYIHNLQSMLNREETAIRTYIKEFKLEEYMNFTYRSKEEHEIASIIGLDKVKLSDRTEIYPYEIDILTLDKKIGIEFNGSYWHSDEFKDKYYHLNKTRMCKSKGIRLIHIFEYEWEDIRKKKIITDMLKYLTKEKERVYARNTIVKEISSSEAKTFINENDVQGYIESSINIGCFDKQNNELIGVMTLGKPRLSKEYDYEIYRLCWKNDILVIGGSEKILRYFIRQYHPKSIVAYSDISKFTGAVYERLGFKFIRETEPNYVWVEPYTNEIYTEYNAIETEDDIISSQGFKKIYDCGNKIYAMKINDSEKGFK